MKPKSSKKEIVCSMPTWIELPKKDRRCRYTGLSRSALLTLAEPHPCNRGLSAVVSVVLTKGPHRGKRLIHLPDLIGFLEDSVRRLAHDYRCGGHFNDWGKQS